MIAGALTERFDEKIEADELELRDIPDQVKEESGSRIDFAIALHPYAGRFKTNPVELAKELAKTLAENKVTYFSNFEAKGPYLNVGVDKDKFLKAFFKENTELNKSYGVSDVNEGSVTVIDYSAPNIAKPFGINHMRSTDIGEAIARIYESTGHLVVRDNHYGDWGTQFGNLLAAIKLWAPNEAIEEMTLDELKEHYVRFSKEKENDPELVEQGRKMFEKLSGGDKELQKDWKTVRDISLEEFHAVYERLGIEHDIEVGEAYFAEQSENIVNDLAENDGLKEKGLIESDDESVIIPGTEDETLRPTVLKTSDGYTVYAARDLGTIEFRAQKLEADKALYVVGNEQDLYFQQIFRLSSESGLSEDMQLEHAGFGLLLGKDGKKLSTRKGTSGSYEELLDEAVSKAKNELDRRIKENPEVYSEFTESQITETAEAIGRGVLIWTDLESRRKENIKLDIERMLKMQEGSSLYVQYAYTRTRSLLERATKEGHKVDGNVEDLDFSNLTERELDVAMHISKLPLTIKEAASENEPSLVADFLRDLAVKYNKLYAEVRVLDTEDEDTLKARLLLQKAANQAFKSAMNLLNLPVVEKI